MVPLVFESEERREYIKNKLIKNKIYPPVHWELPDAIPKEYQYEHDLSKRILSISIDQGYENADMKRMVEVLNGELA